MKGKELLTMLLMSAVLFSGTLSYAADNERKHGKGMHKDFEMYSKELKLTETQKQQIENHRKQNMDEMAKLRKDMAELHRILRLELDKLNPDNARIGNIVKELKELHAKQIDSMVERISEMKKILTPEQFKKMNELMQKQMKKIEQRMQKKGIRGEDCPPGMDEGPGPEGMGGPPMDAK